MIQYNQIKEVLFKADNNTPIKIKRWKSDLLTVYITKVSQGVVWARHYNEVQDVRIYPTKHVEILQIGKHKVGNKDSYKETLDAYYEYIEFKKLEERKKLLKGAIKHKYDLGDGEPIK